ncbi:MAG: class I SAM-dependent methyltransferase [Bacteroidales bacterium]|nr:class I SAM-dependent methyltransferase [Bacteroidales bacterium]
MIKSNFEYFRKEKEVNNKIFLNRFQGVSLKNLKILELGSGYGALSIALYELGAREVVGIDLIKQRIDFSNENLKTNYPAFINNVKFKCINIKDIEDSDFDLIISKATFEHVLNLKDVLSQMRNKLKIGGKIITGFGPLYNSPWGDHNRLRHKLPWMHLIMGHNYYLKKLNENINNITELGFNGLSLKEYKNILYNIEGLKVSNFRTNVSKKLLMKLFKLLSKIPFLTEYFTLNIYCTLVRYN